MKVAVMGAGAIGCYYGGMLARAGHEVTFIGRPQHVEAINRDGLLLETADFKQHVPAKASTEASAVAGADLVLVCVKSADTEQAGRQMAATLAPQATLLCLQNGVDNATRLQAVLGRPVIGAAVYVGTGMEGPGHVRHHGGGALVIGDTSQSAALATTLTAAGIPTTVSRDIDAVLWGKLIVNCAYNALSAVAQISYGRMLEMEGTREVMTNVVTECIAVAKALGVTLPADTLDNTLGIAGRMPNQLSSTAQDLARGKPSEIDFLNGHIVRKGRELGIATPTNLALLVMVKLAEKSRSA
jgi:2-dehydropantoate 2-reductase